MEGRALVCQPASIVGFPVANGVVAFDSNFDGAVSALRRPRIRIVSQPVLGAKLAVDALKNGIELREFVGIVHRSAGAVGDGLERVLAGSIAPILVLYGTNHDCIEQRLSA